MLTKLLLDKEIVVVEIFDKNASEIITLPNNLVLIFAGFKTIILCSVHSA